MPAQRKYPEELRGRAVKMVFGVLSGTQWQTGFRSDGARFTIEPFARYFLHDLVHHRHDVTGVPHAGRPGLSA